MVGTLMTSRGSRLQRVRSRFVENAVEMFEEEDEGAVREVAQHIAGPSRAPTTGASCHVLIRE
jgi:hypothetical protein